MGDRLNFVNLQKYQQKWQMVFALPNPPSHDPSKRPSFDQILIELRENAEFIDDSIDKEDFFT